MKEKQGNCGKCGMCLTVCPVFKVLNEEHASPRARVQLIKAYENGRLESSRLLKELISTCLMCGSCAAICPSGVDHYSKFMDMRSRLISDHGDMAEIRGLVYLLAREQRLRMAVGLARAGQGVVPDLIKRKCSLGGIGVDRFPRLNRKPFRKSVARQVAPVAAEIGTVLYFTGCATNYLFEETGQATVDLLSRMGYRVIIPRGQNCCSIPMLYHGGVQQARDNIESNISQFDCVEAEAVIVDCPTCGSAFKREYPAMMKKIGGDTRAAERIGAKTTDIMSFVYQRLKALPFAEQQHSARERVTYHVPCHLKNTFTSAERVLKELPGVTYVAAADSSECCGGGGTFFYENPEIASEMAEAKIRNAHDTAADIWLTDCPVCRIYLAGKLDHDSEMQVMHPVRYIASLMSS